MKLKPIEWTEEKVSDTVSELTGKTGLGDFVVDCWNGRYTLEKTPWDPEGSGWYKGDYTLDEIKEKCDNLYHQVVKRCFTEEFTGEFNLCKQP